MAADAFPYPPIEPTTFDLIILGTGLPASVIAAASSAAGKSVLHLDPNPFYGSHFSSLPLHDLSSFLHSQSQPPSPPASSSSSSRGGTVDIETRPVYAHVEVSSYSSEPAEESRKFSLDLAGPRVLFCADAAVDLLCRSQAHTSVDFKSVDDVFVCDSADGRFWSLPGSRAAIFKDRSLTLTEKNQLMRFFKLVQEHLSDNSGEQGSRISEEDLETPFVEFLTKMRLPTKIKSAILYAIAMADHDQGKMDICTESKDMLRTKYGIDRLALYQSSIGRLQNASGALLYPMYGQGELPQAFCRRAAVKGCIHVLRMPVIALLLDQASKHYKGVKLMSGQELFSHRLVMDPSFTVQFPFVSNTSDVPMSPSFRESKAKVSRAICITRSSLKADASSFLVVYPPRSLYPEQVTSIRVLQIGSNHAVCPTGMFVVYFSALCEDVDQGKKLLKIAIDTLFTPPASGENNDDSTLEKENTKEVKATLLWRALFIQELTMIQGSFELIDFTPMPDGNLDHNGVLNATKKLFQKLYPDEEFFPENSEKDNGGVEES